MTEAITQARMEDAVASANAFLNTQRGVDIDGGYIAQQVADRLSPLQNFAEAFLKAVPHPQQAGLYVPLSKHNVNQYPEAVATLPGYMVIVPVALVEPGRSALYPAMVSEDGLKAGNLRLHVLHQPYRQQVLHGTAVTLAAAGQSESRGVGRHGAQKAGDSLEAEHYATLLASANDAALTAAWQSGQHVNHGWRQQPNNSVTSEFSRRLSASPQSTITITRQQIEAGQAMIYWHDGLLSEAGRPETARRPDALVVVQSLGYEALRTQAPQSIDTLKRLLA